MRGELIILIAVLVLGGFFLMGRLGRTPPKEARQLVEGGAQLVDVRTRGEFTQGHLPNALNIPVQDLPGRVGELGDKADPVVLYCHSGARSGRAKRLLEKAGFTNVHDLGPMSAW